MMNYGPLKNCSLSLIPLLLIVARGIMVEGATAILMMKI